MGRYSSGRFSTSHGSFARKVFILSFWTSEIDSTPPPTATRMPSWTICFAAVAIAMRPEARWRSTDMPATEVGRPARIAAWRATLPPCAPCCTAARRTTCSIPAGSTPERSTAWRIAWPASSCDCVLLNAPRYALPMGVRAVDTMTACVMVLLRVAGASGVGVSEADQSAQLVALGVGTADHDLVELRPLEQQVDREFPGHAVPPVELQCLLHDTGGVSLRIRAGGPHGDRRVGPAERPRIRRVDGADGRQRRGAQLVAHDPGLRQAVLDRLERPDRAAELAALLHVRERRVERGVDDPGLLAREDGQRVQQRALQG